MTRFEIIVKINGTDYYLDTTDSEGISINYSISDLTDIASRNASFTKTINLPETRNNREVFGFISDLSSDGSLYNPNKRSKVYLLVDSVIVMDGYIQLKKVVPDLNNNATKYECVVYADNYTFFNLINDKYLTDVDFSEYDHSYTTASIIESWTADSDLGYFYPLIDSGYDYQYNDINGVTSQLVTKNFVPATYVKTIIDKMFNNVGFGYQSNFFNSDKFKNLLIPFNNNVVPTSKRFIYDNSFAVGKYSSTDYTDFFTPGAGQWPSGPDILYTTRYAQNIPFNKEVTPYSDPLGAYNSVGVDYWENKTGLNLSTGFVIDLDMDLEWTPHIGPEDQLSLQNGAFILQDGIDYQDYISIYRSMDPVTGWIDPDFFNSGPDSGPNYNPDIFLFNGNGQTFTFSTGAIPISGSINHFNQYGGTVIKYGFPANLTFVVESTLDGSTWVPFPVIRTNGTTASTIVINNTSMIVEELYAYNSPLGTVAIRLRVTSYTSGTFLASIQSIGFPKPRYACPIFNGSTKLNLWGGQAIITPNGTYSNQGYTNTNSNVRLTRYSTDLLNNIGNVQNPSPTYSNSLYMYARPNEKFRMVLTRVYKGKTRTTGGVLPPFEYKSLPIKTTIKQTSYFALNIDQSAFPGVDVDFNGVIPKKVKQTDFMLSLMRMFNLYFEPSKDLPNTLIIEPRDDYYESGEIEDWTRKIDLNVEISEQVIAETQNKYTQFMYKKDSDWFNEDYISKTNNNYGEYNYIMDNDFIKGTKKIELLFSPTPITNVRDAYGIIIPKIIKVQSSSGTGDGIAQHYDFNTRILTKNSAGLISAGGNNIRFEGITFSTYPYIGHLDDPINPTYDLNFGEVSSIFDGGAFGWDNYLIGMPSDNLFNTYYSRMLDEYSNPSSKIVTLSMYLTPVDIANFRFNKSIYLNIDGSGQYYKVLNIDGYDPTSNGKTCKVTLLKTIYTTVPKTFNADDGLYDGDITLPGTPIYIPPYVPILSGLMSNGNNTSRDRDALILGSGNSSGKSGVIVGQSNIVSSKNSVVSGDSNIIADSGNAIVGGDSNTIKNAQQSFVLGDGNSLLDGSQGLIFGSTNSLPFNGKAIIFGSGNTSSQATSTSFIFGNDNLIGTSEYGPTGGSVSFMPDMRDGQGIIFGNNNTVGTSSNNTIFGDNNIVSGSSGSFIIGNGVIATQSNTIYIGGSESNIIISGSVSGDNSTYINSSMIGSGLTFSSGVLSSDGGSVYLEKTYSEISTLIGSNGLIPGVMYKITDRGDLGLFHIAISTNELSKTGQRLMLCPTNYLPGIYSGVYNKGVWYPGMTASANQLAIWGGQVWKNNAGVSGTASTLITLDSNWTLVDKTSFSNGEYEPKQFQIMYDVSNDWIQKQWDGYGNEVGVESVTNRFDILTSYFVYYNPVDITDWNTSKYSFSPTAGVSYSYMFDNKCIYGIFNNSNPGSISNITQNKCTAIINNKVGFIQSNDIPFEICNNIYDKILYNRNNGSIRDNKSPGNYIASNSNNGDISSNTNNGIISRNSNNGTIIGNSNTGYILDNTNNGDIDNNSNIGSILHNINNGFISANSGPVSISDTIVNK